MNKQSFAGIWGSLVRCGIRSGRKYAVLFAALLLPELARADQPCVRGIRIYGVITDPTGAVIAGAHVQAASGATAVTDATGHYLFACVPATSTTITAEADGFGPGRASARARAGGAIHMNLRLTVAPVETDVEVDANADRLGSGNTASSTVLSAEEVQHLSDDPDDLLHELQALAASGGGPPESALMSVNGFQNGSALPPRDSIASIRVHPDLFSSEYENAPWTGGRIEVTTKPGARAFHGALFFVDSDGVFNATDPFSATATPAGKQRYGFELSGPITRKTSDFFLALERRDIHEFNVVNAVTLDGDYNVAPLRQTAAAPQHLWVGSARADWQITPKDTATLSLASSTNNLGNQGIGGLVLSEAGFNSLESSYDLRLLNTQILSTHALHETRIGYSWKRAGQTPLSTRPSLLVAGYFIAGGSTSGAQNNGEHDLEIDDNWMLTRGAHSFKFGAQSLGVFVHDEDPDTFNGAYTFGGGREPALDANNNPTGQTTISGIEQYRRALLNLPGGAPTTFRIVTGIPLVPVTQWRLALYIQDSIRLAGRLTVNSGLRYQLQTTPDSFANFSPRAGFAWAPDKKSNWVLHFAAGLFSSPVGPAYTTQVGRLNGIRQHETTIYSPNFQNPLTPIPGSIGVNTLWQFPNTFGQLPNLMAQAGFEHEFAHHWHAAIDFDYGTNWDQIRQENINAPMVSSGIGDAPDPIAALLAPRPIAPDENIFRYEKRAHQRGKVYVITLRQNNYKRFNVAANYVRQIDMRSDGGFRTSDTGAANPQSTYSELGEYSRTDWLTPNILTVMGNLKLPLKCELSTLLNARSGRPYNITTGTDANGDGDFNDRPSYASAPGPGVYRTRFGLLTTNTVNGNVPRNLGTMPGAVHLDLNLSRTLILNPGDKDHPRTLTLNARSTNLLNHTNVTGVNTILSSGAIGRPIAAETARRVEMGVRFAF